MKKGGGAVLVARRWRREGGIDGYLNLFFGVKSSECLSNRS